MMSEREGKMIVLFLLSPITYCPGEMQLNIRITNAYQFLKVCKTVVKIKAKTFWLNNVDLLHILSLLSPKMPIEEDKAIGKTTKDKENGENTDRENTSTNFSKIRSEMDKL